MDEVPDSVARWELAGGTWRVRAVGERLARVELCTCDGGEIVELLILTGPRELRWAASWVAGSGSPT